MWNSLKDIAKHQNIPKEQRQGFYQFAFENRPKYCLINKHGEWMCSNFWIDNLLTDFHKNYLSPLTPEIIKYLRNHTKEETEENLGILLFLGGYMKNQPIESNDSIIFLDES